MKDRVYICHTFYHAYITVLKELGMPHEKRGQATLILSTMSNDFGNMTERARKSGLFEDVLLFDEKEDVTSKKVMKYHADKGNIILNFIQRMRYTKLLGKLQEQYVPVDLKEYSDVYVFCDSDPIGHYLNYKKIRYHAIEDGLDTLKYCDDARYNNRGHFGLKTKMASMNLIFIENGYSKYCIDMEVNDISINVLCSNHSNNSTPEHFRSSLTKEEKENLNTYYVALSRAKTSLSNVNYTHLRY